MEQRLLSEMVSETADVLLRNHVDATITQYRQLVDTLPAAVYTCDAAGYITMFNKAAAELWGREPEIGKDLWCGSWKIYLTDGSLIDLDSCPMAVAIKEGKIVNNVEIIIERPDGRRTNILPLPKPIYDSGGKLIGAVNLLYDLTLQKRTENALMASEEQFRQFADFTPQIVWTATADGRVDYCNRKWYEFSGFGGENFELYREEIMHKEDVPRYRDAWNKALESKTTYKIEYRFRDKEIPGTYRWFLARAFPVKDQQGNVVKWFGTCTDINDQKTVSGQLEKLVEERTRELKIANEELERSNRDLEQFAYVASHDIKEPIRMVSSYASLLARRYGKQLGEEADEFINFLTEGAERIQTLINDLLEYSRIGKDNAMSTFVDLNKVLEMVQFNLQEKIMREGASLIIPNLPVIKAVRSQMVQLFQNLLENAIKFRSETEPVVSIECNSRETYWVFSVKDNGIGIDSRHRERVFTIFQRLHTRERYPGTGIGLSIVKKIIELHGGSIWLESNPGQGSAFYFTLAKE